MDFVPKTDDIIVELKPSGKTLTNADGSTMTITVLSPYSEKAKAIVHEMTDERIKKVREKKSKDKDAEIGLTSAEVEELSIEGLVRTTVDWNITWDGKQPKFTPKLAKEIYTKAFWIRSLIEEQRQDTLDFMKP